MTKAKLKLIKKICRIVFDVICATLFIMALVISIASISAKAKGKPVELFGCQMSIVVSGSMEPNIPIGNLVVTKKVPFQNLKENDCVLFTNIDKSSKIAGNQVIHRIVQIDRDEIKSKIVRVWTKGDANATRDTLAVEESNYLGVMSGQSKFFGTIFSFLATPLNWIFVGLIIVCAFVAYNLTRKIIKESKNVKAEKTGLMSESAKGEIIEKDGRRIVVCDDGEIVDVDEIETQLRREYGLPPKEDLKSNG